MVSPAGVGGVLRAAGLSPSCAVGLVEVEVAVELEVEVEVEVATGVPAGSRVMVLSSSRAVELACGEDAVGLAVSPAGAWDMAPATCLSLSRAVVLAEVRWGLP